MLALFKINLLVSWGRLHQRYLNRRLVNLQLTLSGDYIVTYLAFVAPMQVNC